jgi:hypothetical protein
MSNGARRLGLAAAGCGVYTLACFGRAQDAPSLQAKEDSWQD